MTLMSADLLICLLLRILYHSFFIELEDQSKEHVYPLFLFARLKNGTYGNTCGGRVGGMCHRVSAL